MLELWENFHAFVKNRSLLFVVCRKHEAEPLQYFRVNINVRQFWWSDRLSLCDSELINWGLFDVYEGNNLAMTFVKPKQFNNIRAVFKWLWLSKTQNQAITESITIVLSQPQTDGIYGVIYSLSQTKERQK